MLLTAANLYYYLHARRLVTPEAVVAGDLHIFTGGSRHRTFIVARRAGPGYFIKQVRSWAPDTGETLAAEARWLQAAGHDPALAALRPWVPRYYDYDPERRVLVVELLPGLPLGADAAWTKGLDPARAAQLGTALGTLQRELALGWPDGTPPAHLPPAQPWGLTGADPVTSIAESAGQAQVLAAVRRYPAFGERLAALRAAWEPTTLIHADLKWGNWLVGAGACKIVDWEFAGVGDPAWDAGTLLQWHLGWWTAATCTPAYAGPDPQRAMQAANQALWQAYVAARGLDPTTAQPLLERTVAYAAAQLIRSAYEMLYQTAQLPPVAVRMIQLSLNILENPRAVITALLGQQ